MARKRLKRGYTLIEVMLATLFLAAAILLFGSLYPEAARAGQLNSEYAQALSVIQHKIDHMRAVGQGGLFYDNLVEVGVIDASPSSSPYRFDGVDELNTLFRSPVGTITFRSVSSTITEATVRLEWRSTPSGTKISHHEVKVLLIQE